MKNEHFPTTIDPSRFAKAGRVCTGRIELKEMSALTDILFDSSGHVDVTLQFSMDPNGLVVIELSGEVLLPLICQRCLEAYPYSVVLKQCLTPIARSEQAEKLPGNLEPFFLTEEFVSPVTLVEEGLLLELPLSPMHPDGSCEALEFSKDSKAFEEQERENPFSVLAELKKN